MANEVLAASIYLASLVSHLRRDRNVFCGPRERFFSGNQSTGVVIFSRVAFQFDPRYCYVLLAQYLRRKDSRNLFYVFPTILVLVD